MQGSSQGQLGAAGTKRWVSYMLAGRQVTLMKSDRDGNDSDEDSINCNNRMSEGNYSADRLKFLEIMKLNPASLMSDSYYELYGSYELQVKKSQIKCSKKVIESSQLWSDMVDFTDPKDDSPILIPSFISKQIILDLVEMVEKDDMECKHLGKLNIKP